MMATRDDCIFDCQHPLWGGGGLCVKNNPTESPTCACDAGYIERDASGQPNCVPKNILITGYLISGIFSLLVMLLTIWHALGFFKMTSSSRSSRRATVRLKVLLASSTLAGGLMLVAFILAAQGGAITFYDAGVVQIVFGVLTPAGVFAIVMIADFWVQALPAQFVPAGSLAAMLKKAAEDHNLFVIIGCVNFGTNLLIGLMTILFDPSIPVLASDLNGAVGGLFTVTVIAIVAVQITKFIDSSAKGSEASLLFYAKAKARIWRQSFAMYSLAMAYSGLVLVRHFTLFGRGSPQLFMTAQVFVGYCSFSLFTLSTKFEQPAGNKAGTKAASRVTALRTVSRVSVLPTNTATAVVFSPTISPRK
ncbi:unnamed protein product [Ascophyllum nodosum]